MKRAASVKQVDPERERFPVTVLICVCVCLWDMNNECQPSHCSSLLRHPHVKKAKWAVQTQHMHHANGTGDGSVSGKRHNVQGQVELFVYCRRFLPKYAYLFSPGKNTWGPPKRHFVQTWNLPCFLENQHEAGTSGFCPRSKKIVFKRQMSYLTTQTMSCGSLHFIIFAIIWRPCLFNISVLNQSRWNVSSWAGEASGSFDWQRHREDGRP